MAKGKTPRRARKSSPVLIVVLIILLAVSLGLLWCVTTKETPTPVTEDPKPIEIIDEVSEEEERVMHEEAELTGFGFMQDFLLVAPPDADEEAIERMYAALSTTAKEEVSLETFVQDIPLFIGVQDIPEQGVSVEDLQITGPDTAEFFTGLNYETGRVLRKLELVMEDGEWKVDGVSEYHKDEEAYEAAVEAVMALVMEETELERGDLELASVTEHQWPDGCLGLPEEDEMCTMAIVPGYEVVIEVGEETRTFRTDMDGSVIREDV